MAKHILKFTKDENVKYVSHLDLVRMFGRAMRRAGLEISFSQGFNPHPIMNFAHPLGVGISSDGELIEIGFEGEITSAEILAKLSVQMPDGFKLLDAKLSGVKSPFSGLSLAKYSIEICGKAVNIEKLMAMGQIITEKKTKSGVKETDIRPLIKSAKVVETKGDCTMVEAVLSCGEPNLKPELFVKVIEETGCGKVNFYKIHRQALLNADGNPLIDFQG
ncbi:MAG: TIGR03936 family radical SAM-associated protein [Clostridia bacterium]|nr:TIGR03936 family radical SAM-associated protein [Clostridia bacterium]